MVSVDFVAFVSLYGALHIQAKSKIQAMLEMWLSLISVEAYNVTVTHFVALQNLPAIRHTRKTENIVGMQDKNHGGGQMSSYHMYKSSLMCDILYVQSIGAERLLICDRNV